MSGNGNYMLESNMEWQQQKLVEHIDKMNEETKARGAVGFLTNDPDHWAGYGVYTVEQFLDYLEREHKHNMEKEERDLELENLQDAQEWIDSFNDNWNKDKKPSRPILGNIDDWRII